MAHEVTELSALISQASASLCGSVGVNEQLRQASNLPVARSNRAGRTRDTQPYRGVSVRSPLAVGVPLARLSESLPNLGTT
jgi:hypothetical protein